VISKFIRNAREVEVDGVSDGKDVLIGAIIEHIEDAGIHSGDATMSIPAQTLSARVETDIEDYTNRSPGNFKSMGLSTSSTSLKTAKLTLLNAT